MTRSEYKVSALHRKINDRCTKECAAANAAYDQEINLPGRRNKWRLDAETKFRAMAERLLQASDTELESFSMGKVPTIGRHGWNSEEPRTILDAALAKATRTRDQALDRLDTLAKKKNDEGLDVLLLTPVMLRDMFGL